MSTFNTIIAGSIIIIISYIFNIVAKKTNVPSVLLLIVLGVIIQYIAHANMVGFNQENYKDELGILGNVGLILIVLEASLDLELKREKRGLILKSLLVALLGLVGTAVAIMGLFMLFIEGMSTIKALIYAVPLSIMSSAIIIPSVGGLIDKKREFMIYESTFSDILGIIFFYAIKGNLDAQGAGAVALSVSGNILVTTLVAVVAGYGLVILLQNLTGQAKIFLTIAFLVLIYAIGKTLGLSPLIIIFLFGLILNNTNIFFPGFMSKYVKHDKIDKIFHDFHTITLESAFVIRTFFFVIFGITISLASLIDPMVALISVLAVALMFGIRYLFLKVIMIKDIMPELFIAPRGLITILLFYSILETKGTGHDLVNENFNPGILLYCILITSIVMTYFMIKDKSKNSLQDKLDDMKIEEENIDDERLIAGDNSSNDNDLWEGEDSEENQNL